MSGLEDGDRFGPHVRFIAAPDLTGATSAFVADEAAPDLRQIRDNADEWRRVNAGSAAALTGRHLRRLKVDLHWLVRKMAGWDDGFDRVEQLSIPDDAEIVGIRHDPFRPGIAYLLIQSARFDVVPVGSDVPDWTPNTEIHTREPDGSITPRPVPWWEKVRITNTPDPHG